jgi:hypothetical protein
LAVGISLKTADILVSVVGQASGQLKKPKYNNTILFCLSSPSVTTPELEFNLSENGLNPFSSLSFKYEKNKTAIRIIIARAVLRFSFNKVDFIFVYYKNKRSLDNKKAQLQTCNRAFQEHVNVKSY